RVISRFPNSTRGEAMNFLRKHKGGAIAVAVFLVVACIVGFAWHLRPDPHLARLKQLGDQLRSDEARNMTREERRQLFDEMGAEFDKLTPEQKQKLLAERFAEMHRRQMEPIKKYFELPEEERTAFLDAQIEREEAWRKEREQRRQQNGGGGGCGG